MVENCIPMMKKPGRSDEVIDADHQLRITDRVRIHFESLAHKRPAKPIRSEPCSVDVSLQDVDPQVDGDIPEFQKLLSLLRSQSERMISTGGDDVVEDEFVETQYYKALDLIDKQHHTTGTGFINIAMEAREENGSDLLFCCQAERDKGIVSSGFKTNPSRNDWIPRSIGDDHSTPS